MIVIKSNTMDGKWLEYKLARMSSKLRQNLNVKLGEFIRFENDIILQVDRAFNKDILEFGEDKIFVTSETFELIDNDDNIKIVDTITMGCDPEFFIINRYNGNLIPPANFFKKWDSIGYDGLLCELRPNPHVEPKIVTNTLFGMLSSIQNKFVEQGLTQLMSYASSAAFGLTAGFHCHMGIPKNLLNKRAPNYQTYINIIVKALDYYVGVLSIIPEGTTENQRRCAPFISYGKVSDYRIDNRTLEYRVPGGTLLKSPELSCGLLSLCSLVSTDVISKLKAYTNDFKHVDIPQEDYLLKELYPNVPDIKTLYQLICVPDTLAAIQASKNIFYELSNMLNYKKHEKNIITFEKNIHKSTNNDIWNNWKE